MAGTDPSTQADAFWQAVQSGLLLLRHCTSCGASFVVPVPTCPSCGRSDLVATEAVGAGRLYSWVVAHHAFDPAFADAVPYVTALIELDEGARLYARLVDVDETDLKPDLEVRWSAAASRAGDRPFLAFRPAQPSEEG
jgi:hypothetical protein